MNDGKTECTHFWLPDMEELRCLYCGRMLYRNLDPAGPRWMPATPAEEIKVNGYNIDVSARGSRKYDRKTKYV